MQVPVPNFRPEEALNSARRAVAAVPDTLDPVLRLLRQEARRIPDSAAGHNSRDWLCSRTVRASSIQRE